MGLGPQAAIVSILNVLGLGEEGHVRENGRAVSATVPRSQDQWGEASRRSRSPRAARLQDPAPTTETSTMALEFAATAGSVGWLTRAPERRAASSRTSWLKLKKHQTRLSSDFHSTPT